MRHRSFVIPAVIVGVLLVGAIAIYVYDSSRDDQIANGITVAGVDVGGMKAGEAEDVLSREVSRSLARPIEVSAGKKHYELSPREVGLEPQAVRMVDEAVSESRDRNILSRVARDVTGGEEDARLSARVSYDKPAVERFVKNVERRVNQPAQDAKLNFPSLTRSRSRTASRFSRGRSSAAWCRRSRCPASTRSRFPRR